MAQDKSTTGPSEEITTIAKGAGVVFIGAIIGTGLRYLFRAIIGRYLGPALIGLFFIGLGIFRISERFACLGIHNGILRYVALYRGEKDEKRVKGMIIVSLRIVLATGIVLGIGLFLISPLIAVKIYNNADLVDVLRLFSVAIPFSVLTTVLVFSTQGFLVMKYKVTVRELFEPVSQILLFIIFFYLGLKLFGAISAFVISIGLGTFLAFFFLKKVFPKITDKNVYPILEPKKLLDFSWPLFFVGFFYLIILWINTLLIGYFLHSDDVGIFGAANNTAMLGQVVLNAFVSIFAPLVSDLYNKNEHGKLEALIKIVTKWVFLLSLPIALIMIYFAKEIINLSFGEQFVGGASCLVIISIALLVNALIASSQLMTVMSGRPRIEFWNLTVVLVINVIFSFVLIPEYGILGAAYSTLITFISLNILRLIEVYILFKLHPFRLDLYKPLVAGGISFLILIFAKRYLLLTDSMLIFLLLGSIIFVAVYIGILLLFGFEEEDKIVLSKIREKVKQF